LRYNRGFTLLEVLVASFILFLVISTMTMVYRGAILSSEKAERSLRISSAVAPIRSLIADKVRISNGVQTLSGSGSMGNIAYQWRGEKRVQAMEPDVFDSDSGKFVTGKRGYGLWAVSLVISYKNTQKEYQFSEVSW